MKVNLKLCLQHLLLLQDGCLRLQTGPQHDAPTPLQKLGSLGSQPSRPPRPSKDLIGVWDAVAVGGGSERGQELMMSSSSDVFHPGGGGQSCMLIAPE